jgi:hypothetical protein
VGVQSTAESSGVMADGLLGVHGRRETRLAEPVPQAHPVHVQFGVRRTHSAHDAWRNWCISKAWWRFNMS